MRRNVHRIDTLIGPTVRIAGDVEFTGGLHLDGRVVGDVRAPDDLNSTLSVSERGVIDGAVESANVILEGTVKGPIRASGRVVLGAKSRVHGDVYYGVIEMTLGAEIMGKLTPAVAAESASLGVPATAEVKFG